MSQAVQVKQRILGAIDRLEHLQSSGVKWVIQSEDMSGDDTSQDNDAEGSEGEVIEHLRASLRKSRVKSINLRKILDQERQDHHQELANLGEALSKLRETYATLAEQNDALQQALRWGDVDTSAIDRKMAAELEVMRAERAAERQELLLVQRELEALLQLDEVSNTEIKETEQSEES